MRQQTWTQALAITLFIAVAGAQEQDASSSTEAPSMLPCMHGLSTPGITVPRGDIALENGTQLELYCIMDTSHNLTKDRYAHHMKFYKNHVLIPAEHTEVINSTTIRLRDVPEPGINIYKCKLEHEDGNESFVCLNKVSVGYKPRPVANFSCISENWESINCTWKEQENPIRTKYKLNFRLPGRAGGRYLYGCPEETESQGYCYWNLMTIPSYRRPYEYYYFYMTGENKLGHIAFNKTQFHHYANVVPAKPEEFTYQNVTYNSVYLQWKIDFVLATFPPGFSYKINYKSVCDLSDKWMTANTTELPKISPGFKLTGLHYANAMYDVRLYMRSRVAVSEDRWSQPAFVTFRTSANVPDAPPRTDIGSFKVIKRHYERDIIIFWQQIPKCAENGEDFHYKVISVEENGQRKEMNYSEIGKSYARFTGLSFNSYKFEIVSANTEGYSKETSVVYVPSKAQGPPEPTAFTKYVNEKGVIRLSWKPVTDKYWSDKIQSYTIFWCQNDREDPNHCTGFLNWARVPKDITLKDIPVSRGKVYEFAISSNTDSVSSGMVWASCTVRPNSGLQEVKSFYIKAIGSSSIQVVFHLECVNILRNDIFYSIYYCPIVSPNDSTCKEPVKNTFVKSETGEMLSNITNLQPYTTYIVYIAPVVIQNGIIKEQGEMSIALRNTTFEAAPSPPINVVVYNVTNQSMAVEWEPPFSMNGKLRRYEIYVNGKKVILRPPDALSLHLTNLTSYFDYSISVSACTVECSNRTEPITSRTAIGAPGIITNIDTVVTNSSKIKIMWKPPEHHGGNLNGYEIKVIPSTNPNITKIYNFTPSGEPQAIVQAPECKEAEVTYKLSVRAFNIDSYSHIFHGPWSEDRDVFCTPVEPIPMWKVVVWVVSVVAIMVVILGIIYGLRRFIKWFNVAQKVEVKLPAGLAPCAGKDKDDLHIDMSWPLSNGHDHLSDKIHSAADEEMLLQKNGGWRKRNTSGDSSGCSSGHDSVSSSLTARTHVSADSGADVDQHVQPLEVFMESLPWEGPSSLRQRNVRPEGDGKTSSNVSLSRSTPNLADLDDSLKVISGWPSTVYGSMPSNGDICDKHADRSYCIVGVEESKLPAASKGYVSIDAVLDSSTRGCDPTLSCNYISHEVSWHKPPIKLLSNTKTAQDETDTLSEDPVPLSEWMIAEDTKEAAENVLNMNRVETEIDSEETSPELQDTSVADFNVPETYCRIGLPLYGMLDKQKKQETKHITTKPVSDYVSIEEASKPTELPVDNKVGVKTSGYVPYKCFDRRDNIATASSPKFRGEGDDQYVQIKSLTGSRSSLELPSTHT